MSSLRGTRFSSCLFFNYQTYQICKSKPGACLRRWRYRQARATTETAARRCEHSTKEPITTNSLIAEVSCASCGYATLNCAILSKYCKSRIFCMHVIFVYFVHGGFRTKIKCMRTVQSKSENLQRSATVRKLSAYEIFWIYSMSSFGQVLAAILKPVYFFPSNFCRVRWALPLNLFRSRP